jgi:hypothetical protein
MLLLLLFVGDALPLFIVLVLCNVVPLLDGQITNGGVDFLALSISNFLIANSTGKLRAKNCVFLNLYYNEKIILYNLILIKYIKYLYINIC